MEQTDTQIHIVPAEQFTTVELNGTDSEPVAADYAARVADMHGMLTRGAEGADYWDSLEKVWAEYVTNEPDLAWQQFSAAMLQAPRLTVNQDRLDQLDADMKVRRLSSEEYAEFSSTKLQVIEDGHYFRGMIEHHRDNFTTKELAQWYAMFNGGRLKSAESDISAAMSEIACWEAAASVPGLLMAVEYGSVEDDSHGGDIKALTVDGLEEVMIDVKAGMQAPQQRRAKTGYKLVIGVPTHLMDTHGRLDQEGMSGMQRIIEFAVRQAQALKKAQ